MLLVAAIGVFCAYPVHWIHQRREFLKKHEVDAVHFDIMTNVDPFSWMKEPWAGGQHCTGLSTLSNVIRRKAPRHTSTLLRLFGEQEFREVKLVFRSYSLPENPVDRNESWALMSIPREEIDQAESLFPEAYIRYVVYFVRED